jgi:hypothetical protein
MQPVAELDKLIGARRVLVLGKGPSLTAQAYEQARRASCIFGINQACRAFACDVAFFIDIEPFNESIEDVMRSGAAVILPWRPNRRGRLRPRVSGPMESNLLQLCAQRPELKQLSEQGRLYYFHTRLTDRRAARNVFEPNLVSLSALLQILASVGVREVRTLGVDGGSGYSRELKGDSFTQLRSGYDKQFPILRRIAMTHGVTLNRADTDPIRIFVGSEPEQWLAARVLEYSIRQTTNEPVSIEYLYRPLRASAQQAGGRTPFSAQRFYIPQLCGYSGTAVYLDSDMQVFANVRELVDCYRPGRAVVSADAPPGSGRRPQFSVMVINCELARWDGDALTRASRESYESTMFDLSFEPNKEVAIPYVWNSLEHYEPDRTRLLHYTDMDLQPWLSGHNKLAPIWVRALNEAVRDGFISFEEIRREVEAGHARPGLLWQIERAEHDPRKLPRRERVQDELFTPPHTVARFSSRNNAAVRAGLAIAKKLLHAVRGH